MRVTDRHRAAPATRRARRTRPRRSRFATSSRRSWTVATRARGERSGSRGDLATQQDVSRRRDRGARSRRALRGLCALRDCRRPRSATASSSMAAPACTCRPRVTRARRLRVQAMGFPAYKMRPALGPGRRICEAVERDARGHRARLRPDDRRALVVAHGRPKLLRPRRWLASPRAFGAHGPTWLEEPLPPDDHDAYRALRTATPHPDRDRRARARPRRLHRSDRDRRRRRHPDGRLLPGRARWFRAIAAATERAAPAVRLPQLGHDARGAGRGAHRRLLARVGRRVARVPVLRQRRARRHVSVPAGRRDPRRAARDRTRAT